MKIQTSPGGYAFSALTLLAVLSGEETALAQHQGQIEAGVSASSGGVPYVYDDSATSSTEQGHTPLIDSFEAAREWRIEKRRSALEDTEVSFNLRAYYFDRRKFDGSESQAFTIGGSVGVKTGYFLDHISFGITGYTSQKLAGDQSKDGTSLLKPGQIPYAVLGEAYADLRIIKDLNIYVGRKVYNTPFINADDTRMAPNTFETVALQGKLSLGPNGGEANTNTGADAGKASLGFDDGKSIPSADDGKASTGANNAAIRYGAGYFDSMKERNSDRFISMSQAAGASVNRGVYAAGAIFEKGEFSIGAMDYYSPDIINIGYAESKLAIPITADWKPKLAAQFVDQRSAGSNLLQGSSFSGRQFGIKADLPFKKALFTLAYTYTTDGVDMRAPRGGYPGYTSVQIQDFDRAGEGAFLVRAGYDFTVVKGLSAYALAVFGTTPKDAGQYRQSEYDFNLQWEPPEGVLKGFSLRLRYGLVQQDGGDVQDTKDFRVICNYRHTF